MRKKWNTNCYWERIYRWAWTKQIAFGSGYNISTILKSTNVFLKVQEPWYLPNTASIIVYGKCEG